MVDYAYDNLNLPGAMGPQGPYGPNDAFDDVFATYPGGINGARANAGINIATTGVLSGPTPSSASLLDSLLRSRLALGPGAGLSVAFRNGFAVWWSGNAPGLGGYVARFRFAVTSFLVGHRAFVGLRNTAAIIGNVDPSTLVNVLGMGYDAGASQWSILHNDAAGACTAVALGAPFNVAVTDLLELELECAANAAVVDWAATNLTTGATAAGTIAANLPASTIFLATHVWANTGADATTATQADLVDIVIQTPAL